MLRETDLMHVALGAGSFLLLTSVCLQPHNCLAANLNDKVLGALITASSEDATDLANVTCKLFSS